MTAGSPLVVGTPAEAGLDERRLQQAYDLVSRWIDGGQVGGAVIALARRGVLVPPRAFGVRRWQGDERAMAPEDVFLVASVTKPVTAAMLVLQVAQGRAGLTDRVADHLPEFDRPASRDVRLIHLLTHTSGLPDMLPDNEALRAEHAPLEAFVRGTCRTPLLFEPGRRVSYQSMGTLLAGEIASRLDGRSLPELMHDAVFAPAGMASTVLGYDDDLDDRAVAVEIDPAVESATDWHWNSAYWRHLGAPWGGMHASAPDLIVWLHAFLRADTGVLPAAVRDAMIQDQTHAVRGLDDEDRRGSRWGLGWRVGSWGDLGSPRAFSHGGATGTLVGADPETDFACVLLTTRPSAPLGRLQSCLQAALLS